MDIGPILGVRPISPLKPSPAEPDLSRVFATEHMGQSADDHYTPHRNPKRGLEDEEQDDDQAESGEESADDPVVAAARPEETAPSANISYFA